MSIQKIKLIIEKGESGIWGRVNYNDNLIIEQADTPGELELSLKILLKDFEGLNPKSVEFEIKGSQKRSKANPK